MSAQSAAQKVQNHPAVVQAQNTANHYVGQLDKELTKYPMLVQLEQRTQIPKAYAALCTGVLLCLLIFINALALPVSNLIGWGLPAFLSFRALESPGVQDDVQWLTYWVVFGFFNFVETFALRLVLYYLPFYFAFKTVFLLWLQLPQFRGAQSLYHAVLKPVMANASKSGSSGGTTTARDAAAEPAM